MTRMFQLGIEDIEARHQHWLFSFLNRLLMCYIVVISAELLLNMSSGIHRGVAVRPPRELRIEHGPPREWKIYLAETSHRSNWH